MYTSVQPAMPPPPSPPSPAVPSVARRLAERGILASAIAVFTKKGAAATRVEDILASAGVARRTFYKYFKSKDDVLAGLYELATSELLAAVRGAGEGRRSALEGVRGGIDVYLDFHATQPKLLKLLVEQAMRSDSPLAPLRRRFRGDLVTILDAAAREATGKKHDPFLFLALVSALEGLSLELLDGDMTPRDIARAKRAMHHLVDRMIAEP
jgi:AcrR family transcriptional regulator